MPPALVATIASSTANSYVTEAEADTIAATFWPLATRWTQAKAEARIPLLIEARRTLDGLNFEGTRVDDVQALEWPRTGAKKPSRAVEYAPTEIPASVKEAQVRLAVWLEEFSQDAADAAGLNGVTSLSLGGEISIGLEGGGLTSGVDSFLLNSIYPLLGRLVRSAQPRILRG